MFTPLQFETNSGTTTHSVEKKIILLCMTFFILLMWLYLAVRKIQRRLQNTVHCKLPQKMGYLQIIPSSAWDGKWWDFGRNLNQEKKFALENFRNELCFPGVNILPFNLYFIREKFLKK